MQVITDFLETHPRSNKTDITSATNIKGLHLFNSLKKMEKDGTVKSEEVDGEMTYSLISDGEEKRANDLQPNEDEQENGEENENNDETSHTGRDHSKFKFNNELYGKSRLVLAVVKQYVEDNPDTTYKQLKEAFPDTLMKRFGVFANLSEVEDQKAMKKRYFFGEDDRIKIKGQKSPIVVCNQWTTALILPFIKAVKGLGYKVK